LTNVVGVDDFLCSLDYSLCRLLLSEDRFIPCAAREHFVMTHIILDAETGGKKI